jgi:transcription antitermination factor NusG
VFAYQHSEEASIPETLEHPWYALQVKTQKEKLVASILRNRGYTDFLPLYTCTRQWSDRIQKMELPLFPGYLFCRFDFNQRLPILTTPGVINVVRLGSQPQPVPQHEIAALETVVRSGMLLRPWPFLKAGQRVVIQEGPLRNVEGLLSEIKGHNQLIVSISLLQRSVAVNIERACVRPIAS